MIRFLVPVATLVVLTGCVQVTIPDSGAGVGFERIDQSRDARDAELRGETFVPDIPEQSTATGGVAPGEPLNATGLQPVATAPLEGAPAAGSTAGIATPASVAAVTNAAGLSQEQDFDAVSGQRGIDDDAARIAAARAQYQVVQPEALPTRPGTNTPNIVAYALQSNNPVGTQIYQRTLIAAGNRYARNCASYASPDLAQEDFLSRGGPQRDRRGLDPDGDGFACAWDPTPFRRAVQPAPTASN